MSFAAYEPAGSTWDLSVCVKSVELSQLGSSSSTQVAISAAPVNVAPSGAEFARERLAPGTYVRAVVKLDSSCSSGQSIQFTNGSGTFQSSDPIELEFTGSIALNSTVLRLSFNVQALVTNLSSVSSSAAVVSVAESSVGTIGSEQFTHGGWKNVLAVGPKTDATGTPLEAGTLKIEWNSFSHSEDRAATSWNIYRSTTRGGQDFTNPLASGISGSITEYTDSAVTPGQSYFYVVRPVLDGTEHVTSQIFSEIEVVAPPSNMALVHRWIANQDVCGLLGLSPDSSNNYRCAYAGWGQTNGYYDLGSHLLIDRFELACNYSAAACSGSACLGTTSPNGSVSAAANSVYYETDSGICYINTDGNTAWSAANSALIAAQRTALASNAAHLPPLVMIGQSQAQSTCQAESVTINGASVSKRLLRTKEWKAASSWDSGLTDSEIRNLERGLGTNGCSTNSFHGLASGNADRLNIYNAFRTGSIASSGCQSRYGLQDMVGNVWEMASDQLSCGSGYCEAPDSGTNSVDATNNDLWSGSSRFRFDGASAGPGGSSTVNAGILHQGSIGSGSFSHFNVIFGLPLLNSDSGFSVSGSIWFTDSGRFHGDRFDLFIDNANATRKALHGGDYDDNDLAGRWSSSWAEAVSSTSASQGVRCGLSY